MRVSVVADVHGNVEALARVAERAERLVVLGDLLDYVDYADPGAGILGHLFGPTRVAHFSDLRAAGDFARLRRYNDELWSSVPDAAAVLAGMVQDRYRAIVDILPPDALVTLGNVDVAAQWRLAAGDRWPSRDAEVVDIDGIRFGFVAGGARRTAARPPTRDADAWTPYVRDADDYASSVAALGRVDVLCSHVPPRLPALRYDTVPAHLEMYGPGLLDYIDTAGPAVALFGHVHQPHARRRRRGRTECINVGHFRRTERAYILETDRVAAGLTDAVVGRPARAR